MSFLVLFFILSIITISTFRYPGVYLSYICFFQVLNSLVFESVGLGLFKYASVVIFLPIFIIRNRDLVSLKDMIMFCKSKISLIYLLIVISIILYCLAIGDPFHIEYLINFIFPWFIIFYLIGLFLNKRKTLEEMSYGFVLFSFLLFVFLYLVKDFANINEYTRKSFPEIFGLSAIEMSRFAIIPLIFIFLKLFLGSPKGRIRQIVYSLLILFFSFQIFSSGTRGPVLGLLIAFMLYLFYSNMTKKYKLIIFTSFTVGLVGVYFFFGEDSLLINRALILTEDNAIESQNRFFRILAFIDLFPDYFLLGIGPGNWPEYVLNDQYPHNIFLELIIELGLVGLTLTSTLLFICYKFFKAIIVYLPNDPISVFVSLLWFSMFFSFSLSGTVASTPFFSYCALLGSTIIINKT
ncbi:O-antigen ligase family protein [Algoriphagus namhaensis]